MQLLIVSCDRRGTDTRTRAARMGARRLVVARAHARTRYAAVCAAIFNFPNSSSSYFFFVGYFPPSCQTLGAFNRADKRGALPWCSRATTSRRGHACTLTPGCCCLIDTHACVRTCVHYARAQAISLSSSALSHIACMRAHAPRVRTCLCISRLAIIHARGRTPLIGRRFVCAYSHSAYIRFSLCRHTLHRREREKSQTDVRDDINKEINNAFGEKRTLRKYVTGETLS